MSMYLHGTISWKWMEVSATINVSVLKVPRDSCACVWVVCTCVFSVTDVPPLWDLQELPLPGRACGFLGVCTIGIKLLVLMAMKCLIIEGKSIGSWSASLLGESPTLASAGRPLLVSLTPPAAGLLLPAVSSLPMIDPTGQPKRERDCVRVASAA